MKIILVSRVTILIAVIMYRKLEKAK